MAKVFKAKYLARKTFLEVNPSPNDSFVWKGFLASKELIRKGLAWRIGDGKEVDMWLDNWLPDC